MLEIQNFKKNMQKEASNGSLRKKRIVFYELFRISNFLVRV